MSWFPALDLAAQYWQGKKKLPQDIDVLDRLRRAISDLPPEEEEAEEAPINETPTDISPNEPSEAGEKATWTVDEDRKLKKLAKTLACDWEEIAARMPRRSAFSCRKRWEKRVKREANKLPWQAEEDEIVLTLYEKLGDGKWREIAEHLTNRSAEAVQNRYFALQKERKQASGSELAQTAEDTSVKELQIEYLKQNAERLEEKIRMYKEELGKLELDLEINQL